MQWQRPLDLLDAAYRLDGSLDDWMGGLTRTAAKVFRHEGLGVGSIFLEGKVDRDGRTTIANIVSRWLESQAIRRPIEPCLEGFTRLPADVQDTLWFSSALLTTLSECFWVGADLALWIERSGWDSSVAGDLLGLSCHDGTKSVAFMGGGYAKGPLWTLTSAAWANGSRLTSARRSGCAASAVLDWMTLNAFCHPGGRCTTFVLAPMEVV
jgi:hypothetical protein